jgi:hypothetical protein
MPIIEMPPKKSNNSNNNNDKTEYYIDKYKVLSIYKKIKIIDDDLKKKLEDIYNDNVWDLKKLFNNLNELNDETGKSNENPWDNGIQYLDYKPMPRKINKVSLNDFMKGEYKGKFVDKKPNAIKTEEKYAKRIKFYTKTFEPFQKYQDTDDLKWIVKENRALLYEIMKYNNEKNNSLSSLNIDLKTMVRVIKLLLGDKDELRYKYTAIQNSLTNIENLKDDDNKVLSKNELNQFVPYEQLLKIVDMLEQNYNDKLDKVLNETDAKIIKHPVEVFQAHQLYLAVALYVLDYPSRSEKYNMDFIENEKDAEKDKNYVLIQKNSNVCKLIFNQEIKGHSPISYNLNSKYIEGLNKRLNKLLKYSYKTYPRKNLFINQLSYQKGKYVKVSGDSVSKWVSDLLDNKNMGVNGFRSSFVSYYLPKMNNSQKTIMAYRMRTSVNIMSRSYYKQYTSPDDLIKVKIDPDMPLEANTSVGTSKNNAFNINDDTMPNNKKNKDIELSPDILNVPKIKLTKYERRKVNFEKWINTGNNREKHRERVKEHSKTDRVYALRIVRELNNGIQDYKKIKPETIKKYQIKINDEGRYYSDIK